jgi:quercetin dioxygenase-like cupin family protein
MLHFSEKPAGVDPGVPYTVRVDEFTLARGARQELTPRNPVIVYVLAGAMTQRIGEKVQRSGAGTVLELPLGTRLVVSNNEPIPMRYLKVELVPTL